MCGFIPRLWEKLLLHFQCILKSIHVKPAREFLIGHYTLLRACTYVCDHAASPKISANADLSTTLKWLVSDMKSIEQLNPTKSQHQYIIYALYLWNVNHTTCTDPPGVQWFTRICYLWKQAHLEAILKWSQYCELNSPNALQYLSSRELMQASTSIFNIKGVNAGQHFNI